MSTKSQSRCRCVEIKSAVGRYMFTDRSNCFKHSPETAAHNKRREQILARPERYDLLGRLVRT
jgi:hypothetical protein